MVQFLLTDKLMFQIFIFMLCYFGVEHWSQKESIDQSTTMAISKVFGNGAPKAIVLDFRKIYNLARI